MTKWISYRAWRTGDESAYHTDPDCHHVGDNHRQVSDDHPRIEQMPECAVCAGERTDPGPAERSCPYCGAVVTQLPDHLPCEESN